MAPPCWKSHLAICRASIPTVAKDAATDFSPEEPLDALGDAPQPRAPESAIVAGHLDGQDCPPPHPPTVEVAVLVDGVLAHTAEDDDAEAPPGMLNSLPVAEQQKP